MRAIRTIYLAGTKADALLSGVARRYGISHAALNALAVIEGAGQPVPTGEVTANMHITTATTTSILDNLERNGYVVRLADPTDRRKVLVDITPKAQEVLDELLPAVAQAVAAAMRDIDDATVAGLVESLTAATEGIARVPDNLPAPQRRRAPKRLRRD